ncbi:MAG: serine--tRNA ligase [Flavobacteriaceae bacterium]|nr:MAG: serine--tRNA ligase [Flavobacteriaceae bacterium]
MLQVSYISENLAAAKEGLAKRNFKSPQLLDEILVLDQERRAKQTELETLLSTSNKISKEIGELYKQGEKQKADALKEQTNGHKEEIKALQEALGEKEEKLAELLYQVPNIPNDLVPKGSSEADNLTVFSCGEAKKMPETAKPHWDLVKEKDLIDFELGVKITGAGFPVYKGKGARYQRALINFFLDRNTSVGYQEIQPPHLVNTQSATGTGQLPDKEGQMYHSTLDDFYLIPTSEVPLTNIYRDVLLNQDQLPVKLTAYTPCFRREAGSYGKDVRGLNRLHQFDKVEIVRVEKPEDSYAALEEMVEHIKGLLTDLELPFRILRLCGGDLGFTSCLTYDFEVYCAAQDKWLEVSSVSNFETFQSNRLKLRYKGENGNNLCHTLNGSALALPRILASLLENHQDEKGIRIPKALVPYTGFEYI